MESDRLTLKKKPALIALGFILVGGILLQLYFKLSASPRGTSPQIEKISASAPGSDWQTYTNTKLGFRVKFPSSVTLRGTAESDFAIFTLDAAKIGKQALITFSKKTPPIGKTYGSLEEFWKDGKGDIEKNGGIV